MISCLCVTHDRHEFMPWVEHQFRKQRRFRRYHGEEELELVIVDSSEVPWVSEYAAVHHTPNLPGISRKRTAALDFAQGEFIAWFDDDDWQSPDKCSGLNDTLNGDYGPDYDAIGARHGSMYSTISGLCRTYESMHEPIIFNSAVYRKSAVPRAFEESLITGEDTEWQERFFASRPSFITLGTPLHAWLCHGKNITNRASSLFFEKRCEIPFDPWEVEFLAKTFGSPLP